MLLFISITHSSPSDAITSLSDMFTKIGYRIIFSSVSIKILSISRFTVLPMDQYSTSWFVTYAINYIQSRI